MSEARLTATVLVPTYSRPRDLERCLNALTKQELAPNEVIVVARPDDVETWKVLKADHPHLNLRPVNVTVPGQVQALNAGLAEVQTDIVAITDDDAAPHTDWLRRIVETFERDSRIAGVGGRDIVHHGANVVQGQERIVGRIPRVGKMIGNHHVGVGEARDVEVLKGVNGAYRTAPFREFSPDQRLRGKGAQVHWEVGVGLSMKAAGWRIIYDPRIVVDHYPAARFDEDQRNTFNALALKNASYNEALLRLERLTPSEKALHTAWAIGIGTRACPGLVQCVRLAPQLKGRVFKQFSAALSGYVDALKDSAAK